MVKTELRIKCSEQLKSVYSKVESIKSPNSLLLTIFFCPDFRITNLKENSSNKSFCLGLTQIFYRLTNYVYLTVFEILILLLLDTKISKLYIEIRWNDKQRKLFQINDIDKDGDKFSKWHVSVCHNVIWQLIAKF